MAQLALFSLPSGLHCGGAAPHALKGMMHRRRNVHIFSPPDTIPEMSEPTYARGTASSAQRRVSNSYRTECSGSGRPPWRQLPARLVWIQPRGDPVAHADPVSGLKAASAVRRRRFPQWKYIQKKAREWEALDSAHEVERKAGKNGSMLTAGKGFGVSRPRSSADPEHTSLSRMLSDEGSCPSLPLPPVRSLPIFSYQSHRWEISGK
jgi:hypothetical protein